MQRYILVFLVWLLPALVQAATGNTWNGSFAVAKRALEQRVYYDHRITLYCGAKFDEQRVVTLPEGFATSHHVQRAQRMEWEHVVPAENFGRTFVAWRTGAPQCIDKRGKSFRGRKCAEKVDADYRLMQADMYNLYPAIGAVNAQRGAKNFALLPDAIQDSEREDFGTCLMKITPSKVEPPERARGAIARTYKYMEYAYPTYHMSDQQRQLMNAWDALYPVDDWECTRAERIETIQGNANSFVRTPCMDRQPLGLDIESR